MKKINLLMLSFILSIIFSNNTTNAQGLLDGFTPKKGDFSVTGSYTYGNFDEFYMGDTEMNLVDVVGLEEITQNIFSLYAKYGVSDNVSFILNVPFISAETNGNNDPINGESSISEIQDVSLAVKVNAAKFNIKGGNLNIITGLTLNVPTGYEPNGVLSVGSGAWGFDYTAGLHLNTNIGLFSTLLAGYNIRDKAKNNLTGTGNFEVPNAFTLSGKLGYASDFIYVEAWAYYLNSDKGVDIGGPNFTGNLPETDVENSSIGLTLYKNIIPKLGASLSYGKVIDGRNVAASQTFSAGLTYNFNK